MSKNLLILNTCSPRDPFPIRDFLKRSSAYLWILDVLGPTLACKSKSYIEALALPWALAILALNAPLLPADIY